MFIAYDFPPCTNYGGAIRSANFAKFLPEFGWDCTIISLRDITEAVPNRENGIHRIRSLTPWTQPYELRPFGWAYSSFDHVKKILEAHTHDLIYVSCPPFPQAFSALKLKRRFNLPLVVDFRDAWSLDPYMHGSKLKKILYKFLFPQFEKSILLGADIFVANTPSMFRAYLQTYPNLKGKIRYIPNGFDDEDFCLQSINPPKNRRMQLLYCGRFGIGARDPQLLLDSIQIAVKLGVDLELKIMGAISTELKRKIDDNNASEYVKIVSERPHGEAIKALFDADILVIYQQTSFAKITPVAGKTFEYLRTGKPILAIAPKGDNLNLVNKYAKYCKLVTMPTQPEIVAKAIFNLYRNFEAGQFQRITKPDQNYLYVYNRRNLTKRLAKTFAVLT